ncbi:MAG TPA: energy-coupling factor ABC transporter permease [Lamprocystis sp. (in: g-proteobacteria)]|nr:energy-coupling factor ABC transporter permease [Lamprocystis sp. (in: g-proteobacteria)]
MHMADALLSPIVGGTLWAATAALTVYASRQVRERLDDSKIPLMGVLGAFIFAAQMINFTIPGTGSSGHLGGGLILAILLGPHAAFLVMASVLTVQALLFADGGLLALGANIFNLAAFPAFVAYPLVYRPLVGRHPTPGRITFAALVAAILGLQLGAFAVVLETVFSGISELPFSAFVLLMQPIHLGIGIVEGLVTAAVVNFVWQAQPDLLNPAAPRGGLDKTAMSTILIGLGLAAVVTGGALSWFASANPDGLEWAIAAVSGAEDVVHPSGGIHETLGAVQEKTALLPDYGLPSAAPPEPHAGGAPAWPAVNPGTSLAGLVGGTLTLLIAIAIGWLLQRRGSAG